MFDLLVSCIREGLFCRMLRTIAKCQGESSVFIGLSSSNAKKSEPTLFKKNYNGASVVSLPMCPLER